MKISSIAILLLSLAIMPFDALATESYAEQTSQDCSVCHEDPSGGGTLTGKGNAFVFSGHIWPPLAEHITSPPSTGKRLFKMILGMAHLLAAFSWIGTIIYVHLVLKPKYAKGGLPKTEMRIAAVSILILGVTGVVLTKMRYHHPAALLQSRSGILLLIKIGLFLFLVASAAYVSQVLSPKLKKLRSGWQLNDGLEGRPAWVRVGEQLYDLTQSKRWKNGNHFGRHQAGEDMTSALKAAPHGPEKLQGFKIFSLAHGELKREAKEIRVLYAMAYINLAVALGVLLVVGAWRFW